MHIPSSATLSAFHIDTLFYHQTPLHYSLFISHGRNLLFCHSLWLFLLTISSTALILIPVRTQIQVVAPDYKQEQPGSRICTAITSFLRHLQVQKRKHLAQLPLYCLSAFILKLSMIWGSQMKHHFWDSHAQNHHRTTGGSCFSWRMCLQPSQDGNYKKYEASRRNCFWKKVPHHVFISSFGIANHKNPLKKCNAWLEATTQHTS